MELHFHNKTWNISCIATDEAPKASPAVLVFKTNSFAASAYTDICRHSGNAVLYRLLCMVCDREGPGVSLRFVLMSRGFAIFSCNKKLQNNLDIQPKQQLDARTLGGALLDDTQNGCVVVYYNTDPKPETSNYRVLRPFRRPVKRNPLWPGQHMRSSIWVRTLSRTPHSGNNMYGD